MTAADLSDQEIDDICEGLSQNAAKVRHLERMGLTVRRKPNGRPLVNRAHYDAVMNPSATHSRGAGGVSGRAPAWSVPA